VDFVVNFDVAAIATANSYIYQCVTLTSMPRLLLPLVVKLPLATVRLRLMRHVIRSLVSCMDKLGPVKR